MNIETLERQVRDLREAGQKTRLLLRAMVSRIQALENEKDGLEAVKTASDEVSEPQAHSY